MDSRLAAVAAEVDMMLARLPHDRQPQEEEVIAMRQKLPWRLDDVRSMNTLFE